jgi:hypothetical protein
LFFSDFAKHDAGLWKKLTRGRFLGASSNHGKMAAGSTVQLVLTHDEATDLFFRCLRSPDEDSPLSELVLSKLARAIAESSEDDLRMSA